jgi:hypothetical protein
VRRRTKEQRERTEKVLSLLSRPMPRAAAIRAIRQEFGVSEGVARGYLKRAREIVMRDVVDPAIEAAEQVERLRRIAADAAQAGDRKSAVAAERLLAEVVGTLKPRIVSASVTGSVSVDVVGARDKLARRLDEMAAAKTAMSNGHANGHAVNGSSNGGGSSGPGA